MTTSEPAWIRDGKAVMAAREWLGYLEAGGEVRLYTTHQTELVRNLLRLASIGYKARHEEMP